jgi:hypothetical protein
MDGILLEDLPKSFKTRRLLRIPRIIIKDRQGRIKGGNTERGNIDSEGGVI